MFTDFSSALPVERSGAFPILTMVRAANGRSARGFIDAMHHAIKLLGSPASVGMALVQAHYGDAPWITAQEAAASAQVSDDTARRKLVALVRIGRAQVRDHSQDEEAGQARRYRIAPSVAESVMSRLVQAGE
jgi:hypothetical protein